MQVKECEVVIRKQASMFNCLETKVALAELSVEFMQNCLQNEHKEAIADLVIAHQGYKVSPCSKSCQGEDEDMSAIVHQA